MLTILNKSHQKMFEHIMNFVLGRTVVIYLTNIDLDENERIGVRITNTDTTDFVFKTWPWINGKFVYQCQVVTLLC